MPQAHDAGPRFAALVGSPAGSDFPAAQVALLRLCGYRGADPHHPQQNAYVERFHRTLGQECLQVHLPRMRKQVCEVTATFLQHSNQERPNQASSCGNRPPRVACAEFPMLPRVPALVDPDRWLEQVNQQAFVRSVQADGGITVNHEASYLNRALAGQQITGLVNAAERQLDIWHHASRIKQVPIKGLFGLSRLG